jgi:hypothetical protein
VATIGVSDIRNLSHNRALYPTIKKNAEAVVVAHKVIGLEINAAKTKYMVTSQDQNAR